MFCTRKKLTTVVLSPFETELACSPVVQPHMHLCYIWHVLTYYITQAMCAIKLNQINIFHGIFDNFYTQIDFEHLYRITLLYIFMFSISRNNRILLKRTNEFVYDLQVYKKDLSPKDYFLACGIGTEPVSLQLNNHLKLALQKKELVLPALNCLCLLPHYQCEHQCSFGQ